MKNNEIERVPPTLKLIFKSLLPKCVLRPGRIIFNWSTLEHLGGQSMKCAFTQL